MRRLGLALALLAVSSLTAAVAWAKDWNIERVYLSGGVLPATVEITDPEDLATFSSDFPAFGAPTSIAISEPAEDLWVAYDLRVVVDANVPDLLGLYYPDPTGGRGYLARDTRWRRVSRPFDALMAKYGAVLPAGLPQTGQHSPRLDAALLVVAGISSIATAFALRTRRMVRSSAR